ncbi:uncharacterized protein H6S33_011841 [Morchella sextelata]|uniref:uncharacterized protein n=1 Tax=Morchella sextelata TaxID=1174677 RepID=UPI001D049727|nr:uncharacterized protein H6S33_011841 [Morchella sextelata]KAH0610314.1 hypothetical protein H6S33_011841 [Morchella sextelata]
MVLKNLAQVCSHLQNISKARIATTSIPMTKLNLAIALGLQDQGFLSSVARGNHAGPDTEYTPITQENVATRRLWLGMKYYDNEPVLSKMRLVSKPTKRVWVGVNGLKMLTSGKEHEYVKPLQPGECMFLLNDKGGLLEAREAVDRQIGGQLLLRVR